MVGQAALHQGKGQTVVRGRNHEGVVRQSLFVENLQDAAVVVVQRAHHRGVGRHVLPDCRHIRQWCRRLQKGRIDVRGRLRKHPVGLAVADGYKERLVMIPSQVRNRFVGYAVATPGAVRIPFVVPEQIVVHMQVRDTKQGRPVAGPLEGMAQVLVRVPQVEAPIGQAKLAAAVGTGPGQQGSPTGGTGGRGIECVAKHHPFLGQPLQIGRGQPVAVRTDVAARVVGVEVDDIGSGHGLFGY